MLLELRGAWGVGFSLGGGGPGSVARAARPVAGAPPLLGALWCRPFWGRWAVRRCAPAGPLLPCLRFRFVSPLRPVVSFRVVVLVVAVVVVSAAVVLLFRCAVCCLVCCLVCFVAVLLFRCCSCLSLLWVRSLPLLSLGPMSLLSLRPVLYFIHLSLSFLAVFHRVF